MSHAYIQILMNVAKELIGVTKTVIMLLVLMHVAVIVDIIVYMEMELLAMVTYL